MFRIDTMSLRGLGSVGAALLMGAACAWAQEQLPSAPQPQPSAGQPATSSSSSNTSSSKQTAEEQQQQSPDEPKADEQKTDKKPPSKLKRVLNRAKPNCANIGGKPRIHQRLAEAAGTIAGAPAGERQAARPA